MHPDHYHEDSPLGVKIISLLAALSLLGGVGWLLLSNAPVKKPQPEPELVTVSFEQEPALAEVATQPAASAPEPVPEEPEALPEPEDTTAIQAQDADLAKPEPKPEPKPAPKLKHKPAPKPKPKPKPKSAPKPAPVPPPVNPPVPASPPASAQPVFNGPAQFDGQLQPLGTPQGQNKSSNSGSSQKAELVSDARVLNKPRVEAPPSALKNVQPGKNVVVRATVSTAGKVTNAVILNSSGSSAFDKIILKAARKVTFEPYRRNGTAVEFKVDIPFTP